MAGITEVNPLDPHYLCPNCKKIIWGDMQKYDCGVDMPPLDCPDCGTPMKRDGYTIPFATFLGFKGNKEPDIDLNFAGEYQPVANRYVGTIFGEKNVFKAGTVGTVAEKTAYGYVAKFFEERDIPVNKYEKERLAQHCTGVKRTTGQHPGGIVVLPVGEEINTFTPVQHPANDMTTATVTTHFDYHSIDHNLLKLDILGHDDPTMIKRLEELTGFSAKQIPLNEEKGLSLFKNTSALGITPDDLTDCELGCLGVPEFGTRTEMKNLNSFKAIAHAIEGERERQIELLEEGRAVVQETRRWDDNKESSHAMRSKEDAQDYRYFPEPDLVPIVISDEWIAKVKANQPELRTEKLERYQKEFDLPKYDAEIITGHKKFADLFEAATKLCGKPKKVSNWIMVETMRLLKENNMDPEDIRFSPVNLAKLINLADSGSITNTVAKEVFELIFKDDIDPEKYVEEKGLKTVNDEGALRETVQKILAENPQSVEDYHNGKEKAIGFLVGQTMKAMKGKANPALVNQILKELL